MKFESRHIGTNAAERAHIARALGYESNEDLLAKVVPDSILERTALDLPPAVGESEVLEELRLIAGKNVVRRCVIGTGYFPTVTPPVILRNVLENPAWYTAYTPYQPEISQGRLEGLLNFQTLITELTGLDIANASLLDEATAIAEAVTMARRTARSDSHIVAVHADTHPQNLAVLRARCEPVGLTVHVAPLDELSTVDAFCVVVSRPASSGVIATDEHLRRLTTATRERGAIAVCIADLLASTLLTTPASLGFDIAVGSAQRFGVPMGFGGPHAAFLAATDTFARSLPGRLVGVSTDTAGRPALRLALQTREQHIRREKATSNICTAQALLANIAGFYAAWHGRDGLQGIARRVSSFAHAARSLLEDRAIGTIAEGSRFDTITIGDVDAARIHERALRHNIVLRTIDEHTVGFSFDETTDVQLVCDVLESFGVTVTADAVAERALRLAIDDDLLRTDDFLDQAVFRRYRTETEMLRYLRRLADKDLALDRTMIPLGSCTMKLNAAAEMMPITWREFSNIHPFAPPEQTQGYAELVADLSRKLCEITGYDAMCLQPNSGAQGEYAGLLTIRAFHRAKGETQRSVCLIPVSAHGTNPASAQMAGLEVVVVKSADNGDIDVADFRAKAEAAGDRLAACMITYPSTHGVFEETVREVSQITHDFGGQVYIDGANMNAMVGLVRPGDIGGDVTHLNLHKTFCIPHGGGGPGVGPIGVKAHLAPFLPGHPEGDGAEGAVSAAPLGSASILPISWAYLLMMGGAGLTQATKVAILNANYIATRLEGAYDVLFKGKNGRVAHECILDTRDFVDSAEVSVDDIAKRLIDNGFHAPTMSWPVAGTLMVEPTESETKAELDRFITAMLAIREEIGSIERGEMPRDNNPLSNAPHTVNALIGEWDRPYSREQGCFPPGSFRVDKYWPPVGRVDNAWGDRHLVCTCPPLEDYQAS